MFRFPFLRNNKSSYYSQDEIEVQDIFLDKLAQDKESLESGYDEKKLEVPLSRWILRGIACVFALALLIFFGKTLYLQVVLGQELQEMAKENTIRMLPLRPGRGIVYDASMVQLAFNKPSFDFVCDKRYLPTNREKLDTVIRDIASYFSLSYEDLKEQLKNFEENEMLIAENISHEQLILTETQEDKWQGCQSQQNTIRSYVTDAGLAHILGYTAKISPEELKNQDGYFVTDQIGKTGIEKSYEAVLRGNPGLRFIKKDARGNIVEDQGEVGSEAGGNVMLWVDLELQKKMEVELKKSMEKVGSKKAIAIAMDVNTGGVLGMVSIPSFDNNIFARGITEKEYQEIINNPTSPLFNRAIAGMYPTGSAIKPLMALGALEEKVIDPNQNILTEGYLEIPNQYDPSIVYRFNDNKNHGWVDMRKALAVSSNVYFYIIGGGYKNLNGLGPSRIEQYLSLFGWGKKTGIDLPGESDGLIPNPEWKQRVKKEGWWDGDTYQLSIGQGNLLATPLQVASAFAAIANGGTLYEPQMVKAVIGNGKKVEEYSPIVVKENIVKRENIQVVKEGLRQAVTSGSSTILNQVSVPVAAKTGTAQTGRKDENGKDYLYSWVAAFAPYDNPKIVITVMVEDAKEGSIAVLPVAKDVLNWYFSNKQ